MTLMADFNIYDADIVPVKSFEKNGSGRVESK